ncbi:unnamed protein product [Lactuca virosa]|uniref:Uncharacterized protein n=1 Tax=Lactuca virosa TaxID=75947 RepID=A0AAU9MKB2_9ASTR|nr:unnamed protein product [Lactuca virosa]
MLGNRNHEFLRSKFIRSVQLANRIPVLTGNGEPGFLRDPKKEKEREERSEMEGVDGPDRAEDLTQGFGLYPKHNSICLGQALDYVEKYC